MREKAAVRRIVEAGLLDDGAEFNLATGSGVSANLRAQIDAWVAQDERRSLATWVNDAAAPLLWAFDGLAYSPTGLAQDIIREATSENRTVQGPMWWVDGDGRTLVQIAVDASGPRQAKYAAFWGRLLERVHEEQPGWTKTQIPPRYNWLSMPGPRPGIQFSVNFPTGRRLRFELYIGTGDKAVNKQIYDELSEQRDQIETGFGGELSWERLDHRKASRIATYRPDSDIDHVNEFDDYIDWFLTEGAKLRLALAGAGLGD